MTLEIITQNFVLAGPASGAAAGPVTARALVAADIGSAAASLGANTFTGGQNFARATVASAATTADIWAAAGNQIDWTGTATTTIFPNAPQAGAERVLICAGACSFTAGANMLIDGVASAATVTCAANDQVIVRAVSTTQFKLSRVKYDGTPQVTAGGGSMVLLSTVTASTSATVDVETTFDATYDAYVIVASGVTADTDGVNPGIRFKVGGSYDTGSNYIYTRAEGPRAGMGATGSNSSETAILFEGNGTFASAASASLNFTLNVYNPSSTSFKKIITWLAGFVSNVPGPYGSVGSGINNATTALTGIRFYFSTGNVLAGKFRLYGIKNS